jgi:hypothetical protein
VGQHTEGIIAYRVMGGDQGSREMAVRPQGSPFDRSSKGDASLLVIVQTSSVMENKVMSDG